MIAKPEMEGGINELAWIWENKRQQLKDSYKGCKIRMNKKKGCPQKLSIRLLNRPFSEVPYMNHNEKEQYGEKIFFGEDKLHDIISNLLHDMPAIKMVANGQEIICLF